MVVCDVFPTFQNQSHTVVWVTRSHQPYTRWAGATESSCTPMFTFFMELLRRRRGKIFKWWKGDCGIWKRGNCQGKTMTWESPMLYVYIIYICQCIHIACYVYNYDICFKDAIQYSILHDCLSTRKHQQFWWFCHQEHFKTSNVSCVYGFLCVRWRFALCKSSTVFNRLVEYGSDGLKRQLTAENILSGPTRLKQIMSGLLCSKYHGTDLSLNISPRKTCHWFKQLQCHWSYSPLLQSFWNQSTCFLHFVCLISLRCWATRIEHWRKQVHNKSMTTITHYINLYETA